MSKNQTIIPKDALLCDFCNDLVAPLENRRFIAIQDATWLEGYLLCNRCSKNTIKECECGICGNEDPEWKIIMKIQKGNDLTHTELAYPIVMESWD